MLFRSVSQSRYHGGNRATIRKYIKEFGFDTSHFTGIRHQYGKLAINRLHWKKILVKREDGKREESFRLRRALIESGLDYSCEICASQPIWQGKKLLLQVDHKNGIKSDDSKKNLRFLCPNCHSQTNNFCGTMGFTNVTDVNDYSRYYYKKRKKA